MINDEAEFLQGIQDCKRGITPPPNANADYLRGYSWQIDREAFVCAN